MKRQLPFELVYQISALVVALIIVHLVYITLIRPNAAAIAEVQAEQIAAGNVVDEEQSIYVILKDYEQESCFILMI